MPYLPDGRYVPRSLQGWIDTVRGSVESSLADAGIAGVPRWLVHETVTLLSRAWSFGLSEIDEALTAVQSVRSVDNASGEALREMADLVGVIPGNGTASGVTLTVGAWANGPVLLSAGVVKAQGGGTDGSAVWVLAEDVIIPAGSTATVEAVCQEVGPTTASPGDISRRLTGVPGWVSVTNAASATSGTAADTEADIRNAIKSGAYAAGARSELALRDLIEQVDGVEVARVVMSESMTNATVSGRTVYAGGLTVWVYPSTISDASKLLIGRILFRFKAPGRMSFPTSTGADGVKLVVVNASNQEREIGYWWVRRKAFRINVVIDRFEPGYTYDDIGDEAIENAAEAYFATLKPGDYYAQQDITDAINDIPGIGRSSVTAEYQDNPGSDPATDTYTLAPSSGFGDVAQDAADVAVLHSVTVV